MPLNVAYLVNQYPKVSHSFIRREILALERQGVQVRRFALRGWSEAVVDPEDLAERERTRYVLEGGLAPLLWATARCLLKNPARLARAARLALAISRGSDRPLLLHLAYLAEACWLARWLESECIEHVHAHFGTNSTEVALLAHVLGGPTYSFTVHGPEEFDKPAAIALGEKIRGAAFVVAISSYGRSQIYRWSRTQDWDRVKVVHCGVENRFHSVAIPPVTASPRLVCVGRLCEQKGQLLLIHAVHRLVQDGVAIQLVLAGDGELRGEVELLIASLRLNESVRITGWISSAQVREEMLAARALVLPSFAEGLPVVIMEAMALGRPVLSTYVAGIPELVVPGETGWLFPAGDVVALAEAMTGCLAATPALLDRMGAAARRRVVERHDIDTEAAKLLMHFNETVARRATADS